MYTNERFDAILAYLKLHKRATVAQMSRELYVSEATVRRDLQQLQQLGLLKRTHGGAVYSEATDEVSIVVRQTENALEKSMTADIALAHLPEFETAFLDNSSTSLTLAAKMDFRHKLVVTNGFQVAQQLLAQEARVLMPCGELHSNTGITGSMACRWLRDYRFDLMLCSCAALSPEGAFERSLSARDLKQSAMERADRVLLLADRHKFTRTAPYRTAPLEQFAAVYTDSPGPFPDPLPRIVINSARG